ncbi:hypothetical protein E2C01_024862 [Portunus trituberculatus]|uniref:Uncharacterized protein n=1 Tax=Portunus trituberculatus TaxID=210409 RepID=A0A5B7EDJ3_PORTR|nr:hypothetical protein [Portunus trituberculatus]
MGIVIFVGILILLSSRSRSWQNNRAKTKHITGQL